MSHMIVQGIDTVYTPAGGQWEETWHGLQTPVEGGISVDGSNIPHVFCPIVQCGVKPDFEAEVSDVPEDCKEEMGVELKNWKMILADCRKGLSGKVLPLHVPKKGYQIHQNLQLFGCMAGAAKQVLGEGNFEIVTVGTLGAYSQFFVSIAIKGKTAFNVGILENGAKDVWNQFFNLNSSHNGLIGSNRMLSTVRIVCQNTVQMSIGQASQEGTITAIKHTGNSVDLITPAQFEKDLQLWVTDSENLQKMLAKAKQQKMTADKFKSFAAGVFTTEESDALSVTSYNRVNDMVPLFERGEGNQGKTRYDGLNSFTQFFTSGNGVGKGKDISKAKRIATANFGRGNEWKLQAMQLIADNELFAETCERGERLYDATHKAVMTEEPAIN